MSPRQAAPFRATPEAAIGVACLWLALALLYSSPLWTTYWFGDEVRFLRPEPFPILGTLWMPLTFGLLTGRPIFYFFAGIYLGIASSWDALPLVRIMHFTISATALSLFLGVLYRRSESMPWALFTVLFLAGQPVMQIYFAASVTSTYWFANGLGCAAFLYLRRHAIESARSALRPLGVTAALLMVAWMTFQTGPFCGLALVSYYALTSSAEHWLAERRAGVRFIALLIATMVVYLAGYGLLLALTGATAYSRVTPAFDTLRGATIGQPLSFLRLSNYLGPFEWWNYAVPIGPLSEEEFQRFASFSAGACFVLIGAAFMIEVVRSDRREVCQRYALALVAAALTPLPMIADVFSGRQHLFIAFSAAVVLVVARSVSVIVAWIKPGRLVRFSISGAALAGLCIVLLGARAGFERSLVQPNAAYYAFAREQARRAAKQEFTRVVVVDSCSACLAEPCRGVLGFRMRYAAETDMADFYRAIVRAETGRTEFDVEFAPCGNVAERDPATTLWIDLRQLDDARSTASDQGIAAP